MTWFRLASKEWQRRPLRTSLTATGVAIAIAALFSLLAFQQGYRQGVRRELDQLGAQVLVAPKGCPYDAASIALHGASWPCYLKAQYLEEVRGVPGVATATPVFMAAVYAAGEAAPAVYVGVEESYLALRPGWHIHGTFPKADGSLLIGSDLARRYGWQVGQELHLPGLGQHTARVTGILAPTQGPDDGFMYLRLGDAQRLFNHTNELTHILVRLADPDDLDRVVAQLRGCDAGLSMNVVPLAHVFRTIQSTVNSTRLLLGCLVAVALLVAGTGVSNAVLMAVTERAHEHGVLRAIGASPANLFRLVWLETIQVCLVGGMAGVLVAFLASRGVEALLRSRLPFAPADTLLRWEWWMAFGCLACAVILGSLSGFLPAWRAAYVPPLTAIRAGGGRV